MSVSAGSDLNGRDFQNIINDVGLSHSEAAELAESLLAGGSQLHGWTGGENGVSGWGADLTQRFFSRLKHDLLSKEEEIELGLMIRTGREAENRLTELIDQLHLLEPMERTELKRSVRRGNDARDKFITSNLRLARSLAVRYVASAGHSLTIDDLFQECFFALNRAVDLWDPDRGFRFSTYAVNWIRQTLSRLVANQSRTIRLPVHVHDEIRRIEMARSKFELANQRDATDVELSTILREPVTHISMLLEARRDAVLFAWPEGMRTLSDEIDFDCWVNGDQIWSSEIEPFVVEVVAEAFDQVLNTREREVLIRRFGFGNDEPETLEAIGASYRLTRERIRQIESKALSKLKASSYGRTLASLIGSDFFEEKLPIEQKAATGSASTESASSTMLANRNDAVKVGEHSETSLVASDPAETFRAKYGLDLSDDFVIDVDGVKPVAE
jgi:RNA polymerase primary sigma factor